MAKVIVQKFRDDPLKKSKGPETAHKTPIRVSSKNTSSYITLDKNMSPPQIPFKLQPLVSIYTPPPADQPFKILNN